MKLNISVVLGILMCLNATAQDTGKVWGIEECVNYALENNIQIKQTALQVEANKTSQQSAKWDIAPNFNLNSNYGWNFGLNIDPVTNEISQARRQTASLNLQGNWVVFNGLRKHYNISKSNLDYLAALYDLEDIKNDISLNVAASYLQILLNKEILVVAKEQERVSQLQVNRTTKLVEAGASPKGDQLQLEAQLARDHQNVIASENALTISKLQLANLLQLENPDDFEISSPDLDVPEAALVARDPASIFATAMDLQPAIKGAETRVESSEKNEAITKSGAYPTLSVVGQVGTSYSDQILEPAGTETVNIPQPTYDQNGQVIFIPFSQTVPIGPYEEKKFGNQVGDNLNEYIGLSLSVPLFNGLNVHSNKQIAEINTKQSQLQLEMEKNTLRQTIYQAHADAKASYNSYLAAEVTVESSEESFKYSKERFEVGALNQFDFENAKNSLAIAKSEMLRSKYDYIFKTKVLEFYLTNQIKL
ncbi:outer membrane protein [Owenweeksia hongkongensis DSM 17368]|uniref:Outer membrane protein n=1 Tax=Owenweeksia hongkongensis (strain DSM 17368 / CIP 108786 / JCM 12287 / NRRL B-23963 / UST20020801) TaxID=926562 RepID=G8R1V3_OWEHD|nr:TolC family protein [Owenweeksia hongkongensis]AEV32879.1 outer membrane protein [Owenweeksia hongkongensis DSM 17368]